VNALEIAAQYYAEQTAQGKRVTSQDLANVTGRSRSWGTQTLRKLKAQGQPVRTNAPKPEPETAQPLRTPEQQPEPETAQPEPEPVRTHKPVRGTRVVVWSAFVLGLGASVAANVAAAGDGIGPRIAAGFAPVALLVAVEIIARMRKEDRGSWWLYIGTAVIAGVTAVVSYGHMRHLLTAYGESELAATILPLAPDGLILVACAALMRLSEGTRDS
jgi:hypothetical protein